MSRYINQIRTPVDPNTLTQPITEFMLREGFKLTDYKGVQTWKKGSGIMTQPQFLQILYGPDYVEIQAFIRFAILPGVYVSEMGINGFFQAMPKSLLKQRVTAIEQYIISLWNNVTAPANQ